MGTWKRLDVLPKKVREELLSNVRCYGSHELHDMYDEMLDDCYPQVNICGYEYQNSQALKAVDPIAYRVGFSDWLSCDEAFIEYGEYYSTEEVEEALNNLDEEAAHE
jgi:hypothetical protein